MAAFHRNWWWIAESRAAAKADFCKTYGNVAQCGMVQLGKAVRYVIAKARVRDDDCHEHAQGREAHRVGNRLIAVKKKEDNPTGYQGISWGNT
jgi:hypothetical protein